MPLVEPSQDGLVPQMQANLTLCSQRPRRASALTARPAGARRPHTGAGRAPQQEPRAPAGVRPPQMLPWPSSVFYGVAVRAAQGQASGLVKLVWRLEFKALGRLTQGGTAERGG